MLFPLVTYSQKTDSSSNYKPPRVVFELGGAFNYPIQDAFGSVQDFFKFQNFGMVYGVGFHFNAKYCADKKGKLFPYLTMGFAQLQNEDGTRAFIDSNNISYGYPLPGSQLYNNPISSAVSSVLILRDFYVGVGFQYAFNSSKSVIPFVGLEVDYHLLWGLYTQQPGAAVGNNSTNLVTFSINPASKVGIGADLGFDFRISQNLGFMFGTKYKLANLFGKKSERTQPVSINPGDLNTINLLDKADTGLNTNLNKSRDIAYLQFYLGFAVFIGKVK